MKRLDHFHDGGIFASIYKLGVGLRGVCPIPSISEGVKLRLARQSRILFEQNIVIRIRLKRRVKINEINAGIGENLFVTQPFQIVAEKEFVHVAANQTPSPPFCEALSFPFLMSLQSFSF